MPDRTPHWKQHDKKYSSNFPPTTDAVRMLRSILLILKLVSIVLSQEGPALKGDPKLVVATLWQVMEKPLKHISICFDNAEALRLAGSGYEMAEGHANAQHSCQLATAILRLMLPLLRISLKERVTDIKQQCAVLKCLLLPQWGLPAAAAKAEFLKSGVLSLTLFVLRQLDHICYC